MSFSLRWPRTLASQLSLIFLVSLISPTATGGTGLGLAIAQQLALAIGGSLTLSNREGGGLCAELKLTTGTESPTFIQQHR